MMPLPSKQETLMETYNAHFTRLKSWWSHKFQICDAGDPCTYCVGSFLLLWHFFKPLINMSFHKRSIDVGTGKYLGKRLWFPETTHHIHKVRVTSHRTFSLSPEPWVSNTTTKGCMPKCDTGGVLEKQYLKTTTKLKGEANQAQFVHTVPKRGLIKQLSKAVLTDRPTCVRVQQSHFSLSLNGLTSCTAKLNCGSVASLCF